LTAAPAGEGSGRDGHGVGSEQLAVDGNAALVR
jgi:hypothetical protein